MSHPAPRTQGRSAVADRVLIFGGAGLVGMQVARQVAERLRPSRIVIASLWEGEVQEAVKALQTEFPEIEEIVGVWGNIFVREEFSGLSRAEILGDKLEQLYEDVFGPLVMKEELVTEADREKFASEESFRAALTNIGNACLAVRLIKTHQPDVVVDCINTATGISYQDVKTSGAIVKRFKDRLEDLVADEAADPAARLKELRELARAKVEGGMTNLDAVDGLLVSMGIPQLIRHVLLMHRALIDVGSRIYVKVGTTGTGGMGVHIPYTHGEDKPSFTLLSKSSVGFAHTGLLFLLGRSPGPIIKEIKPAAMIGYKRVEWKEISKFGRPVHIRTPRKEEIGDSLLLRGETDGYEDKGPLQLVGVDTGENGFFSRGEYEAISHLHQMEFVTPEEIARVVLHEIIGANTGLDVIGAIDAAVMDPSYRAGYLRQSAIDKMEALEAKKGVPSVAIGQLGPPQLTKLLYEAYLLRQTHDSLAAAIATESEEMSRRVTAFVEGNPIRDMITSLGIPILLPDGKSILRGPEIHIPESKVEAEVSVAGPEEYDEWARQGWVDLRPDNFRVWKDRFRKMLESQKSFVKEGSAAWGLGTYQHEDIRIGEVVGWIFNNEIGGYRIK
jgi:hypothetical protein